MVCIEVRDIMSVQSDLGVADLAPVGFASAVGDANFWQNFGKMLLVFGCIGTDFCK